MSQSFTFYPMQSVKDRARREGWFAVVIFVAGLPALFILNSQSSAHKAYIAVLLAIFLLLKLKNARDTYNASITITGSRLIYRRTSSEQVIDLAKFTAVVSPLTQLLARFSRKRIAADLLTLKDHSATVNLILANFSVEDRNHIADLLNPYIARLSPDKILAPALPDIPFAATPWPKIHVVIFKTFLYIFLPAIAITAVLTAWAYFTHQPLFQ